MEYIKILKRRKIIEIALWLTFVIVSYFFWNFEDIGKTAAYYLENSLIEVIPDNTYSKILYAISDDMAQNLPNYNLTLSNSTYRIENYNLFLGVSKNINQDHLKIKNATINYISDIKSYEDDEFCYYLLDTNTLTADTRNYQFSLYNDESQNFDIYSLKFVVEKIEEA